MDKIKITFYIIIIIQASFLTNIPIYLFFLLFYLFYYINNHHILILILLILLIIIDYLNSFIFFIYYHPYCYLIHHKYFIYFNIIIIINLFHHLISIFISNVDINCICYLFMAIIISYVTYYVLHELRYLLIRFYGFMGYDG